MSQVNLKKLGLKYKSQSSLFNLVLGNFFLKILNIKKKLKDFREDMKDMERKYKGHGKKVQRS